MKTNSITTQTSKCLFRLFRQYSTNLLSRFVAIVAMFALLIPTLLIIPFPKVAASKSSPTIISAPPEVFNVGSWQLAVGSWQLAV